MDDLDIVSTKTDVVFFQDGSKLTVSDYLQGVEDILIEIQDTGNFEFGIDVVRSMTGAAHAVGISLAKLLHGMMKLWDRDTDFYEYLNEFTPITRLTASRYIDAWAAYLLVPDKYQEDFAQLPMKNLNALGAAIAQGFELEEGDWNKLAGTTSNTEFLKVIREDVKECEPRKNSITIYLEKNGDLIAWCDGEKVNIGYLDVASMEDGSPIITKAIHRITKSSGLLVR